MPPSKKSPHQHEPGTGTPKGDSEDQTIQEVGERALIQKIWSWIPQVSNAPLALFDDAFVQEVSSEVVMVLNTDMLVGRTDVPPQMTPFQAGRKAVIMNISDLGVKGARPQALVVSLGLPKTWTVRAVRELITGIAKTCEEYHIKYVGGDLNECDDLVISPTVWGIGDPRNLIPRRGARPGDIVAINGEVGLTGVGFQVLLHGRDIPEGELRTRCVQAVLQPNTRIEDGVALGRAGIATASIDCSDGLHASLAELGRESKVGFRIEREGLPLPANLAQLLEEGTINASLEDIVFYGGEEFFHIFTIPPDRWEAAKMEINACGGQLHQIGRVTEELDIVFLTRGEGSSLRVGGWEHWR